MIVLVFVIAAARADIPFDGNDIPITMASHAKVFDDLLVEGNRLLEHNQLESLEDTMNESRVRLREFDDAWKTFEDTTKAISKREIELIRRVEQLDQFIYVFTILCLFAMLTRVVVEKMSTSHVRA